MLRTLGMILGLGLFLSGEIRAADEAWTQQDYAQIKKGQNLLWQQKNEEAEAVCQGILDRHPHSSAALIYHIEALDALGRYQEALEESQKAADFETGDAVIYEWMGISYLRLGQLDKAIHTLKRSLKIDPDEESTSIWLGATYWIKGDTEQANKIFAGLLHGKTREDQGRACMKIADVFHKLDKNEEAFVWWKKSADLGNIDAPRFLEWAYASGTGLLADTGDSTYWSRRAGEVYPWFPRLSFAEAMIKATGGWILVAVLFAAAAILPALSIELVGQTLGRNLTTDPAIHWTERARRSYPMLVFLGLCGLLPFLCATSSIFFPASMLPIPKWPLFWAVFAVGIYFTNFAIMRWARRFRENPGTAAQNLQNIGAALFLYAPIFVIFWSVSQLLPTTLNLEAWLVLLAGVIAYFWLQFGGWIRLGRLFFLITPADGKLKDMVKEVAARWNHPTPRVWMFGWQKANALAFIFSNAIVVTKQLYAIAPPEEMKAILAHELAHLCEDRMTKAVRLLLPLLFFPFCTFTLWDGQDYWYGLIVLYVVFLVALFLFQKRRRRMEERADTFGKEAESEAGVYPRALARLYEANLIPAVMPGKRKVHPHLYDRLVTAGITPDYPRPSPPAKWGLFVGLLIFALNAAFLTALWLSLF